MKVSYNWLKQYIDISLPVNEVGDILTEIGLEVEGVEKFESIPGSLEGIVVGHVKSREKHPDADKLAVTTVDIGGDSDVQIVCGAPNVAAGQKVVVATVGSTLYPLNGDPFKIKKAKIRGQESFGMICAEDEIGLGQSHDGIMVLEDKLKPGTPASEVFEIETDYVYEIGLTPNRSDGTSHIGVAEDLAAALKINYQGDGVVKWPFIDTFEVKRNENPVTVEVNNTELCPRYSGVTISGITVGPSPEWLVNRLAAVGIRTTNNVVDITNYVLHEYGQPLHAFDMDQVAGQKIIVKTLPEGTDFISLDEVTRKLSAEDLMICNGNSEPMCIAGVFGGLTSGVSASTTSIFLESAHFNAKSNRRSSMRHNLRTDAAKVFEKGSDPNRTVKALKRAALLIIEVAGGYIDSEVVDIYPEVIKKQEIQVAVANVNRLIGAELSSEKIKDIFEALHIDVLDELTFFDQHRHDNTGVDAFRVAIPTNKFDVTREVDVIEEILRIYGFNKVDYPQAVKSSLAFTNPPESYKMKNLIGDFLVGNGYSEMMGMSITQSKYFPEAKNDPHAVFVNNTSNQHMDLMRPNIMVTMLEAVSHNHNRQNPDVKLFEFGNTYSKQEGAYLETTHLGLVLTGNRTSESWHYANQEVSYFSLKTTVQHVLSRLGIKGFQMDELKDGDYIYGMTYFRGPNELVRFGQLSRGVLKTFGVKSAVFFADFNWANIMKALKKHKIVFEDMPKFPSSRRDLAMVLDKGVSFAQIEGIVKKQGKKILQSVNLFDVYINEEKVGKDKKSYSISMVFQDPQKTLKDKDVDGVVKKVMYAVENQLGGVIRK